MDNFHLWLQNNILQEYVDGKISFFEADERLAELEIRHQRAINALIIRE